jgi:hypothetical protein
MTTITTFPTFPAFAYSHILMFCEYPDANSMPISNAQLRGRPIAYFPSKSHMLIAFQRIRARMEELGWILDDSELGSTALQRGDPMARGAGPFGWYTMPRAVRLWNQAKRLGKKGGRIKQEVDVYEKKRKDTMSTGASRTRAQPRRGGVSRRKDLSRRRGLYERRAMARSRCISV